LLGRPITSRGHLGGRGLGSGGGEIAKKWEDGSTLGEKSKPIPS